MTRRAEKILLMPYKYANNRKCYLCKTFDRPLELFNTNEDGSEDYICNNCKISFETED